MQFRGFKLIVHAFRSTLGINHFTLYGLYVINGTQLHWQLLSPSPVSNWANSSNWRSKVKYLQISYFKKRNEKWQNTNFFLWKTTKMLRKVYVDLELHFLLCIRSSDPWCNMLQTLETRRKYRWKEIVSWTHSWKTLLSTKN